MGILSGSVTFMRFDVARPRPRTWGDEQMEALRRYAAESEAALKLNVEAKTAIGAAMIGWTAGGHCLDKQFDELKQIYPDHLLFEMQVTTQRLPADLLKAYYETDLTALAKENPSGKPTRANRKEAKESARRRLAEEADDGRYIKRKMIPCLWDNVARQLLVGTTSLTQLDRVQVLFEATFDGELILQDASAMATRNHAGAAAEQLSNFVPGVENPERPAWCNTDTAHFLGNEFLLWLWYYTQIDSDTVGLPDGTEATIMFSGGVKVEDPRAQTGKGTLNSDSAVRLPEARTAIRHGKLPRQAALTVVRTDEQYSFILQAEKFAVTQCRLPKPPADMKETRAREEHRLQAMHDLAETIELLYLAFLNRRIAMGWDSELRSIQKWLQVREGVAS